MKYLAAVAQLCSQADKAQNYARMEQMIAQAAEKGAKIIVFPEFANSGEGHSMQQRELIPEGEACIRMAAAAKKYGIYVHFGSIYEQIPGEEEQVYNTAVLFSPEGQIIGKYSKTHLADFFVPPDRFIRESKRTRRGEQVVNVETPLGTLGLANCYDLRFPELFRTMALDGAQVFCVCGNFYLSTGSAIFEVMTRARAIENGCYVLAPNQCAQRNGVAYFGNSMIVDPMGRVLARAGQEQEEVLYAEIDTEAVEAARSSAGGLSNRRPDLYDINRK